MRTHMPKLSTLLAVKNQRRMTGADEIDGHHRQFQKFDPVLFELVIFQNFIGDRKETTGTNLIPTSFEDLASARHPTDVGVLLENQDFALMVGQNLCCCQAIVTSTDYDRIICFRHIFLRDAARITGQVCPI